MKKLFSYMMVCGAMMTAVLGFTSCEDDLDVQQTYPFTVETMPVPKRLVQGETAEIRCEIVREGISQILATRFVTFSPMARNIENG